MLAQDPIGFRRTPDKINEGAAHGWRKCGGSRNERRSWKVTSHACQRSNRAAKCFSPIHITPCLVKNRHCDGLACVNKSLLMAQKAFGVQQDHCTAVLRS